MRRALVVVVMLLAAACGREGEPAASSSSPSPTPSAEVSFAPAPTTSPEVTIEPVASPTGSPEPSDTQAPEPTVEACRDSTDEACGEFRWDPEPGENGDLSVTVSYSPKTPKAGDSVTFFVVAKDDGGTPALKSFVYGDGKVLSPDAKCEKQEERFGPWTPPDPDPQDNTDTYTHTYDHSGNFEAIVTYSTKRCDFHGYNPYGSEGRKRIKVDVAPDV